MDGIDEDKAQDRVATGAEVALAARALRSRLRRRTKRGSRRRQDRIDAMLFKIDDAMKPIRSVIAQLAYHDCPPQLERDLRAVSADLQAERRRLKKMR